MKRTKKEEEAATVYAAILLYTRITYIILCLFHLRNHGRIYPRLKVTTTINYSYSIIVL